LQHRGQESAGIATCHLGQAHIYKAMGLVTQVFTEENLSTLPGHLAIGHNRYSTTGSSHLRNAQPLLIETVLGPLGVAHNGNLINAPELRRDLLQRGVGLSTSSDSEVIVQMLAGLMPSPSSPATRFSGSEIHGGSGLCVLAGWTIKALCWPPSPALWRPLAPP
jgi:glutamine phosphoribosylpyrophosphate amidotransferase